MDPAQLVSYTDEVETIQPDEDEKIDQNIASMRTIMGWTADQHRHGLRGTHAKNHGVVKGTLTVPGDLPEPLRQGLFATPGSHAVVMRYTTETGQLDDDRTPAARGLSVKIFDVPGDKLRTDGADPRTQDFLFNTLPTLPPGDVTTYLEINRLRQRTWGDVPTQEAELQKRDDAEKQQAFGQIPNIHPLAHTFYTQGAFRFGDYIAKLSMVPVAPRQRELADRFVSDDDPPSVLRDMVREYYATHGAEYELRAQLCTDLGSMPVEDASVQWPEHLSEYRTVATVTVPAQDTYSSARRVYSDDSLIFRPWNGLAAHRPLGSINRLRRKAYQVLGAYRLEQNAAVAAEPSDPAEIPD